MFNNWAKVDTIHVIHMAINLKFDAHGKNEKKDDIYKSRRTVSRFQEKQKEDHSEVSPVNKMPRRDTLGAESTWQIVLLQQEDLWNNQWAILR